MINEGIQQGKYEITTDTIHKDLEKFQSFLYHNFKSHKRQVYKKYNNMRPVPSQSAPFFATAKTNIFDDYSLINANNLKLRSIIDESNTFTYDAAKISAKFLTFYNH